MTKQLADDIPPPKPAPKSALSPASDDGKYRIVTTGEDAPSIYEGKLHLMVEAENATLLAAPGAKQLAYAYGRSTPGFANAGIDRIGGNTPVYGKGRNANTVIAVKCEFVLTPGLPSF